MGLYVLVFAGGSPIGGPLIGVITTEFGARTGMAVCGLVPLLACVAVAVAMRHRANARTLALAV